MVWHRICFFPGVEVGRPMHTHPQTAGRPLKVLVFIRQRSHARYVMLDLAVAARRLGWTVQWLDLEGLLIRTCRDPDEQKRKTVATLVGTLRRFDADVVFSYGLEYLERSFTSYLPEMTCSLQDLFLRPSVHFLFDF